MKKYDKSDLYTHEDYLNSCTEPAGKEGNEYITETAGFVPLEVKLKQFEQNGLVAQFQMSDFDSHDMRELYLNPDFDINPEDEIEDVEAKLDALRKYQEEYKAQKKAKSNGQTEKAGTEEPEKKAADAAETAEKQ